MKWETLASLIVAKRAINSASWGGKNEKRPGSDFVKAATPQRLSQDRGRRYCKRRIRRIPDQIEGGRNREHRGPLPCHRKHGANRTGLRQCRQARGGDGQ